MFRNRSLLGIATGITDHYMEEWARPSVKLRNRIQARFNAEELDAVDRFILLASQGSDFDYECR